MFERYVKDYVKIMGYGVWYQNDAWNTVKNWPASSGIIRLHTYLVGRYPQLNFEGN